MVADTHAVRLPRRRGVAGSRRLLETMYLLSSPRNAERLRESLAEARAGHVQTHDLDRE